jgi:hypothetical protein
MPGSSRSSTILIVFAVQVAVAFVSIRSISATARELTQDPLQQFATKIAGYMALRQHAASVPEPPVTPDVSALDHTVNGFGDRIRAERPEAKPGDIFTKDVSQVFRERIAEVRNERGINLVRDEIHDEVARAADRRVAVNGHFNWGSGSAMPPEFLEVLPTLPEGLEYRFVNRDLVLVDLEADLVVDVLHDAVPRG